MVTAIYPGSFDPLTNGHTDIIIKSLGLFDKIIVAVADNPRKNYMFTIEERCKLIRSRFYLPNIEVVAVNGLVAEYAVKNHIRHIVRGIRNASDALSEMELADINKALHGIETVFLMCEPRNRVISSSLVKELVRYNSYQLKYYVNEHIEEALKLKMENM